MKITHREDIKEIIRDFFDLIEERGIDDIEELEDLLEEDEFYLLGSGAECHAYYYRGICIKDYYDEDNTIEQMDKWENVLDSALFPEIYGSYDKYIFMELIKGVDYDFYKKGVVRNIDVQNVLKRFAYDHLEKNIITYDLHSNNIMIDENDNIKIIDIGYFEIFELGEIDRNSKYNYLCRSFNEWYPL